MAIPINWSLYDSLIKEQLPLHTIEEFTKKFIPQYSSKAVGARARKLEINLQLVKKR